MKKLNEVITKALVNEDFRKEFLSDPMKASEGFNLTETELAQLRSVDLSELSQVNTELEERLSKSFINLPNLDANSDGEHTSHSSGSNHNSTSHSSW